MVNIGFTPRSEHSLGGDRAQGRGGRHSAASPTPRRSGGGRLRSRDEMVPGDVAAEVTKRLAHPDDRHRLRIGVRRPGPCLARHGRGMRTGRMMKFVKQYADMHGVLLKAARDYAADVADGTFPGDEHTFSDPLPLTASSGTAAPRRGTPRVRRDGRCGPVPLAPRRAHRAALAATTSGSARIGRGSPRRPGAAPARRSAPPPPRRTRALRRP